jgi:hypothetical protein
MASSKEEGKSKYLAPSRDLNPEQVDIPKEQTGESALISVPFGNERKEIWLSPFERPVGLTIEETDVLKGLEESDFLYLRSSKTIINLVEKMIEGVSGYNAEAAAKGNCAKTVSTRVEG